MDIYKHYKILIRKRKKANFGWGQETRLIKKYKSILSIDEAGRGSFAGPLSVGGIFLDKNLLNFLKSQKIEFYDSKKLLPVEREMALSIIRKLKIPHKAFLISHKIIETYGINGAFLIGIQKLVGFFMPNCIVIDGIKLTIFPRARLVGDFGLVPCQRRGRNHREMSGGSPLERADRGDRGKIVNVVNLNKNIPIKFFTKGDEKLNSLGAASIVAKVKRDKYMTNLSRKYPKYKFEKHKGYGTELHRKLIQRHGLSNIHRKSFCRNISFS